MSPSDCAVYVIFRIPFPGWTATVSSESADMRAIDPVCGKVPAWTSSFPGTLSVIPAKAWNDNVYVASLRMRIGGVISHSSIADGDLNPFTCTQGMSK